MRPPGEAGQEGVGTRKREANAEVDLLEPFENKGCGEITLGTCV
jgi:hypothetical protein